MCVKNAELGGGGGVKSKRSVVSIGYLSIG